MILLRFPNWSLDPSRPVAFHISANSLKFHYAARWLIVLLRQICSRSDYWVLLNASTSLGSDEWDDLNGRILTLCNNVWEAVRVILCFDAPEGSNDATEELDDLDIGEKDTLSYCWRALKESRFVYRFQGPPIERAFHLDIVAARCYKL